MFACSECHNCGSIWSPGTEEYDWQKCSACGWEPGDPIEEDHGWDEDDYELDDDELTTTSTIKPPPSIE